MARRSHDYLLDDARAEEWVTSLRAMVVPRPHLEPRPGRCALLVVDAQRYFAHPAGRCFLPATRAVVPRIAALLAAWRAGGHSVVFSRHGHAGPEDLGMLGRFFSDYIRADEPDARIVPELAPRPGEPVVRKTTYDAFLGTDLEPLLRARGTDQVLVTGVLTHLCVDTTARSAFCRGFEVHLAVDAVASSTEALHVGALAGLADGVACCWTTREILERITGAVP